MRDEKTSARVAAMAAKVMAMDDGDVIELALKDPAAIRSIAASAVTQARDREADPPERTDPG